MSHDGEMEAADWAELVEAALMLHEFALAQQLLAAAYDRANNHAVTDVDQLLGTVRRLLVARSGMEMLSDRQQWLLFER